MCSPHSGHGRGCGRHNSVTGLANSSSRVIRKLFRFMESELSGAANTLRPGLCPYPRGGGSQLNRVASVSRPRRFHSPSAIGGTGPAYSGCLGFSRSARLSRSCSSCALAWQATALHARPRRMTRPQFRHSVIGPPKETGRDAPQRHAARSDSCCPCRGAAREDDGAGGGDLPMSKYGNSWVVIRPEWNATHASCKRRRYMRNATLRSSR